LTNSNNDIEFRDTSKNYEKGLKYFIEIFDNIYNFSYTLIHMFTTVRYQASSLEQISSFLKNFYSSYPSHSLPVIQFKVEKMFTKESLKEKISGNAFQVIINYTAFTSINQSIDNSIYQKIILK